MAYPQEYCERPVGCQQGNCPASQMLRLVDELFQFHLGVLIVTTTVYELSFEGAAGAFRQFDLVFRAGFLGVLLEREVDQLVD